MIPAERSLATYRDGVGIVRCRLCFCAVNQDDVDRMRADLGTLGDKITRCACAQPSPRSPMSPSSAAIDRELPGLELVPLGPPFVVDSVALERRGPSPTLEQCGSALDRVKKVYSGVRYWLGDLMNLTETLFQEEASQYIDASYLSEQEVKDYRRVAEKVAPTTRAHAPSWEHARAVCHLLKEEQVEWLDKARGEDWSARKLSSEVQAAAAVKGKTVMKFWLVVECGTEAKRDTLASRLTSEGFSIKKQEKLVKVKKAKKGPVTAQKKRKGAPKMNTRKRVPR